MYFYYQLKGGEEQWHEALASQRESIIASKAPRYATILNLSTLINDETTSEEIQAIRYFGDLYFDFDSDDIEMCISQVQKFIKKLNARC